MAWEKLTSVKVGSAMGSAVDGTNSGVSLEPVHSQSTAGSISGVDLYQTTGGGGWGMRCNSGHAIVGKKLKKFKASTRINNPSNRSDQDMTCKVYDGTDKSTVRASSNSINTSTLTSSFSDVEFTFSSPVVINAGDVVVISCPNDIGTAGGWNCEIKESADTNGHFVTWVDNGSFTLQTGRSLKYDATTVDYKVGTGAYTYDGSNDYTECGSAGDWNFLHDGTVNTVAFFVKRDGTQASSEPCVIDTQGGTASNRGMSVYWSNNSAGTLTCLISDGTGSDTKSVSCGDITNGEWTHIAIVNDGTNLTSYKNGDQEAQTSLSGFTPSGSAPAYSLNIGRNARSSAYFKGNVDDLSFWRRALTATEIEKLAKNNVAGLGSTADGTISGATQAEGQLGGETGEGNDGADAGSSGAGGGGGAGQAGQGKHGGNGRASSITGSSVTYAGGGGGAHDGSNAGGNGGTGGGGNGGSNNTASTGGTNGLGGGAGGGGNVSGNNATGGSGVVILRFTTSGTSYSTSGSPNVDTTTVSGKTILKYTSSGTFVVSGGSPDVEYLVVAGGGGSMTNWGHSGGAGAGGMKEGTKSSMANATYTVTVGSGGASGSGSGMPSKGGNSVFSDITSEGGGYGGNWYSGSTNTGGNGGSGGGGQTNYAGGSGNGSTGSYSFDGSNDTINIGNSLDGMLTGDFSFTTWAYMPNATSSSNKTIICKPATTSWANPYHSFTIQHTGGNIDFQTNNGSTNVNIDLACGQGWHHIAVTKSGTTFTLYIDGTTSESQTIANTAWGTQDWIIGNTPYNSRYFDGKIDDMAFWSRALTATEIQKLVNNNQNGKKGFDSDDTAKNNIANGKFSFNMVRDGSSDGAHWDLFDDTQNSANATSWTASTTASNSQWVLRAKMKFTAISGGGSTNGNYMWLGLSKNYNSFTSNDNIDTTIMCQFQMDDTSKYYTNDTDNDSGSASSLASQLGTGDNSQTWTPATDGTYYYVDIRRTSSTAYSVSIYTGDDFSSGAVGTITGACPSGLDDLRFIKVLNYYNSGTGRNFTGEIAWFKFYDGTNSPSNGTLTKEYNFTDGDAQLVSTLSNTTGLKAYYPLDSNANNSATAGEGQLATSLADQTKLSAYYNMDTAPSGARVDDDFSSYANQSSADAVWESSDTAKVRVNITDNDIDFDSVEDDSNDSISYDLGSTVSNTKWLCRFKFNISTADNSGLAPGQDRHAVVIGLFDVDETVGFHSSTSKSGVYLDLHLDRDGTDRTYFAKQSDTTGSFDGAGQTSWSSFSTGTDYYCEIKRTSGTNATMTIRTGSHSGSTALGTPLTLTSLSGLDGLRYFGIKCSQWGYGGRLTGTVDDVQVWDDTNTPIDSTITNNHSVPTGETAIGDSLNTGVFTAKKYLKVHMKGKASSDISFKLQFNGDTGSTYSFRNSLNSATDPSPDTGASYLNVGTSFTGTANLFTDMDIINISNQEKLVIAETVGSQSGASNEMERKEFVGKWSNTASQITRIVASNSGSGNYDEGTAIIVYGTD